MRLATLTLLFCSVAHAARSEPPPLVESLRQGYGVVAVTLVEHKPTGEPNLWSLHLRVEKLVAAPAVGPALPVKLGQVISVPANVGYGGEIEHWAHREQQLKPGLKFLMVLHVNQTTGDLEGIGHSGAVRVVDDFDPAALAIIARIRELAVAKPPEGSALARRMLDEPNLSYELRWNAHTVLRGAVDPAERAANMKFLKDQWQTISLAQPYETLFPLDQTLCEIEPTFRGSDLRCDGWLNVVFSPLLPANDPRLPGAANDHLPTHELQRLGVMHPDKISGRVIREMHEKHWPLQFRWRLAGVLQHLYQTADVERREWDAELQKFYPAAFAESGPWELRLLPSAITYGLEEPKYDRKRRFVADAATWDAMAAALARMEALARQDPQHPDAVSAVATLREALKHRPR